MPFRRTHNCATAPPSPSRLRVDYLTFLSQFHSTLLALPVAQKSGAYRDYLTSLLGYLRSLYARNHPLLDAKEEVESGALEGFDEAWANGEVENWPKGACACARARARARACRGGGWWRPVRQPPTPLASLPTHACSRRRAAEVVDPAHAGSAGGVDLGQVESVEQLLGLGLEALKAALSARGLKCG